MFGGATGKYKRRLGAAFLPPSEECFDCSFYILDLQNYSWKDVGPLHGMLPRCHHSASYTDDLNPRGGTVVFVGGLQFTGFKPTHRLPLTEIELLHISDPELDNPTFSLQKVHLEVPLQDQVYLSYHDSTFVGKQLFVWGGCVQDSSSITEKQSKESDAMYIVHMEDKTVSVHHGGTEDLCSAGGTLIPITNDVLLIAGGTSAKYSIFTTRNVEYATVMK